MPAQMRGGRGPDGALLRLRDAMCALREAAGAPSYRKISQAINQDNSLPATASHTTVGEILTGRSLTGSDTLHAVVLQLLRMSTGRKRPEGEVWSEIKALWTQADQEKRRPLPKSVQAFASTVRDLVIDRLGSDLDAVSRALRLRFPTAPADTVSPAALAAVARGARVPDRHQIDQLLALMPDGRDLPPGDRQALMCSYFAALRDGDPARYEEYLAEDERAARHAYTSSLEDEVRALRRELRETGQQAARGTALALRRKGDAERLQVELKRVRLHESTAQREAERLRTDLHANVDQLRRLQDHVTSLQSELTTARVETSQAHALATLKEAEATVASAAGHLRPMGDPAAYDSTVTYDPDGYGGYGDFTGYASSPVDSLEYAHPYGLGKPDVPWPNVWPSPPATTPAPPQGTPRTAYGWALLGPLPGPAAPGATGRELEKPPAVARTEPSLPAVPPHSGGPVRETDSSRSDKGLFGRLQSMFQPGHGRHARRPHD
ncbi:hypothetical protein FHS38_005717 [Streptomyces netropsis]|uniref:Uncharacterized protein n=1 Tax=Streptomyces netropsis TaxID=55404 RepID=A0A7W7PG56_STRNE|nr:hypothetical protein [Streptomyces netropsis]MBB4889641.1 hypothetical protein [Streptomyces netropsis]